MGMKTQQVDRQFNSDYPRFISTAHLTPDGLFWATWDRLNNVQVSRVVEHERVHAHTSFLNLTWGAQQSPRFETFEN